MCLIVVCGLLLAGSVSLVACCYLLLFAVWYRLFDVCGLCIVGRCLSLFVVRWLFSVCCSLLVVWFVCCCLVRVVFRSVVVVPRLSFVVRCSCFVVRCVLFVGCYCTLYFERCLWFVVYCLLVVVVLC